MNTELVTTKSLFQQVNIQQRFADLLGDKAQGFISSVLQTVNNNKLLAKATPVTVLNAAATAATLGLPINQNLGFAWIIPYNNMVQGQKVCEAQFQMGWKGYVQLALRTAQYKNINVTPVYKNQFKSFNAMTEELNADFTKEGNGEVVGYVAYLKLLTGFEKTVYWSKKKVTEHAKKYSKAYSSKFSPWQDKDQFDSMAMKTVLKSTISKWGIMSIEMETAQLVDQSVQRNEEEYSYVDNTITVEEKKEKIRDNNDDNPTLDLK